METPFPTSDESQDQSVHQWECDSSMLGGNISNTYDWYRTEQKSGLLHLHLAKTKNDSCGRIPWSWSSLWPKTWSQNHAKERLKGEFPFPGLNWGMTVEIWPPAL